MDAALFDLNAEVEETHWWFSARRAIMTELISMRLPADGTQSVVDVGCGTGANLAALAATYRCVGIDPTELAISHARERFPDVHFIHGSVPDGLGDHAAAADGVLLMDVLEHVEDDTRLLRKVIEPLAPGASVFITVPADDKLWSEHDVSHGHFRRYDAASLRAVWSHLPVEEIGVSYFNARLYPLVRVARVISRMRGRSGGDASSDVRLPSRPINAVLRRIFGGERGRLARVLEGRSRPYRRGVSLVAVLVRST